MFVRSFDVMNVTNAESSDVVDDYPYQVAGHANGTFKSAQPLARFSRKLRWLNPTS